MAVMYPKKRSHSVMSSQNRSRDCCKKGKPSGDWAGGVNIVGSAYLEFAAGAGEAIGAVGVVPGAAAAALLNLAPDLRDVAEDILSAGNPDVALQVFQSAGLFAHLLA